ncbi:MAG: transglutaminase-like cysteine peptidase [Hyphomicrobium sp.]
MKCVRVALTTFVAGLGSISPVLGQDYYRSYEENLSPFMRVYGSSQPPFGFVNFCESNKNSCLSRGPGVRFDASPESLSDLDDVNRLVNKTIQPATDEEIYGISEYWTIPIKRGDCEDYALLKQKVLMARGWPSSSLLLTVVRDEKGEGHAVLTARTTQGDFILDNKTNEVRLWIRSPYRFVMRQSYLDPKVWVSLDPQEGSTLPSLAGFKQHP